MPSDYEVCCESQPIFHLFCLHPVEYCRRRELKNKRKLLRLTKFPPFPHSLYFLYQKACSISLMTSTWIIFDIFLAHNGITMSQAVLQQAVILGNNSKDADWLSGYCWPWGWPGQAEWEVTDYLVGAEWVWRGACTLLGRTWVSVHLARRTFSTLPSVMYFGWRANDIDHHPQVLEVVLNRVK